MAKKLFKKSLAWMLTLVLIVLSVPMAAFMASAEAAAPTPDATDIGSKLVVSTNNARFDDFWEDGVLNNLNSTVAFKNPVFGTGIVYASAKFKMNGNVHYGWTETKVDGVGTGEYAYTMNYNNVGFHLAKVTMGDGTSFNLHISYRRAQGIYMISNDGCSKVAKTMGATKNLDELTLTVKFDPATYTFSIWENGVHKGDVTYTVDPNATDAATIKSIQASCFGIAINGSLGSSAVDPEDATNPATVPNTVDVSDVHLWGDVTSGKTATKAPTMGANATDVTSSVTIADEAMNADWKEDGQFDWTVAAGQKIAFNGIDFTKGNGKVVYATLTMTNLISTGKSSIDIYGTYFDSAYDYNYVRPSFNHQGVALTTAKAAYTNISIAGGEGTLNHKSSWKVTYKWDVDLGTVDMWLTTGFHNGYGYPDGYGAAQDFYIGKYYLNTAEAAFGLRVRDQISALSGTTNVKDVKVWTEKSGSTTNMAASSNVWVGGTMTAGTGSNILTTTPNFGIGTTMDTDGVYDGAGSGTRGRKTVYWSELSGDLSKGSITYEADLTLFPTTSAYERQSGFVVATVDGHYVTAGLGVHNSDKKYRPYTFINGGNLNEGGATTTVLGGSASQNLSGQAISPDDAGTTVKLKVVLTADEIIVFVNDKLEQCYNVAGKNVVPFFGYLWQAGNTANNISNVKIYGDGVSNPFAGNDMMSNTTAFVGGKFVGGHTSAVLTTTPVMNAGTEIDTDGVYVAGTNGKGGRAKGTIVWSGLNFDLSKGGVVIEGTLTLNPSTDQGEIHLGFVPCTVDGHYVVMGLGYHTYNSKSDYFPQTFINAGNANEGSATQTVLGGGYSLNLSSIKVEATNAPGTANVKIMLSSTKLTMYINGKRAQEYDLTGKTVVPTFGFVWSTGNANDSLANVKIYGEGVSVCTHTYSDDFDTDCDNCGATRTAPGSAYPEISGTNYAGSLVFNNPTMQDAFAQNGSITTGDANVATKGLTFAEKASFIVKTNITFNGNVDYYWAATTNEETGEVTYSYKQSWGRTGVQIGTYRSTKDGGVRPVFVSVRKSTGGVYIWDNEQRINGADAGVISLGSATAALSDNNFEFVVKYDATSNKVAVWVDGTFISAKSIDSLAEFTPVVGVTQHGSGNTAVDANDPTNGETTPNTVTFSNFGVYGDITTYCVHVYDNDCDAKCNKCDEPREVADHVYDDNCEDANCNVCGATRETTPHVYDNCDDTTCANCSVTREAVPHVYDDDCQDTTCANCSVTRPAADHVYDDDCTDTTCNNCSATREYADHVYDDDCTDTTCNNCSATREAVPHVYDDDCQDTTCANCSVTREAVPHVYDDDCQDTTCANCSVTRPAAEHIYDDDCTDTTCNNCSATREYADHVYDNACDGDCNNCSVTRIPADHVYDNNCEDADCNECGATRETTPHVYVDDYDPDCENCDFVRELPERPSNIVIGSGDNQVEIKITVGEILPVLEKVGTKFVLGWTNSLGEVVETYNGESDLVADYVETLMMTVKYQLGKTGNSIRFIASVDGVERYSKVGWLFTLDENETLEVGNSNVVDKPSNVVYKGLIAGGVEMSANDVYKGAEYSQYLYMFEIKEIPDTALETPIYVRPYVVMEDGSTVVYGEKTAQSYTTIKEMK